MKAWDSWIIRYGPWLLSSVLFQAGVQGTRPTVSLYLLSRGAPPMVLGLVVSLYSVGALLLSLPIGRFIDRIGGRNATLIGTLGTGVCFLPVVLWDSIPSMAVVQALTGVFFLVGIIGSQHGVAAVADQNGEYARGYGLLTMSVSVGQMLGPGIMGFMVDHFGYGSAMFLAAMLSMVAGVLMLFTGQGAGSRKREAEPGGQLLGEAVGLMRDPAIRAIIVTGTIVLFAQDAIMSFFPLYTGGLGMSATETGLILFARGLALVTLRPFMGVMVERFGQVPLLNGSLLGGAVATGLLGFFDTMPTLLITAVLAGLAIGLAQPLTMVMVTEATPREQRGLALSLRMTGNRIGTSVSPVIQGMVVAPLGAGAPLWLSGLVMVLGSRLVVRSMVRRKGE